METLVSRGAGATSTMQADHVDHKLKPKPDEETKYVYYFGGGRADGNELIHSPYT